MMSSGITGPWGSNPSHGISTTSLVSVGDIFYPYPFIPYTQWLTKFLFPL
jgi:hypothetical protein